MKLRTSQDASKSTGGTIPKEISAGLAAKVLGLTDRAVRKRSVKEEWPCEQTPVPGGFQKVFPVESLPEDVRLIVLIHYGQLPSEMAECIPEGFDPARIKTCMALIDEAQDWQKELAKARLKVLKAWQTFRAKHQNGSAHQTDHTFIKKLKKKTASGIDPGIYSKLNLTRVSRTTLHDWNKRFFQQGLAGLISRHGHNKGQTSVPTEQQELIKGILSQHPTWGARRIQRELYTRYGRHAVSRWKVQTFVSNIRENNSALLTYLESPAKYKNLHQPALGDASESATHFLHTVEVDSTSADVRCLDGKRYTILGAIDRYTRCALFHMSKTSNSQGIAALLWKVCMQWGLPYTVIRDQGKDYMAERINEAFQALEIESPWIPPYTPEAKPFIERMFRTLAHGLEEKLPGFVGHNVAEQQARRSRVQARAKLCTRGETVLVNLTPSELQTVLDEWTEHIYHKRKHSALGMSPSQKRDSCKKKPRRIDDPLALSLLMTEVGQRKVNKGKINYNGGVYLAEQLLTPDRLGTWVSIRVDPQNVGKIYVFDVKTRAYICTAIDRNLLDLTPEDYTKAKKRASKAVREQAKAFLNFGKGLPTLDEEIARAKEENPTIRSLPIGEKVRNPFVDAAVAASEASREEADLGNGKAFDEWSPLDTWEPVPESLDLKVVELFPEPIQEAKRYFRNPLEKFNWLRLEQRIRVLDPEEIEWMHVSMDFWIHYAECYVKDWDEFDQEWLAGIAPDHFAEYFPQEELR